jgi:hypothetical protein
VLVYRGIYNDMKNLMPINQNGFMKNRSTITNPLKYASFVLNSIKDGNQVDSIQTDFSKAFDRVRHQLLLRDVYGYRAHKMHVAGTLTVRENPENKNR